MASLANHPDAFLAEETIAKRVWEHDLTVMEKPMSKDGKTDVLMEKPIGNDGKAEQVSIKVSICMLLSRLTLPPPRLAAGWRQVSAVFDGGSED